MSMAAIVGGTASKLGGGKFANGAVSGAFVHMYNFTAHITASGSGGMGYGGTEEGGWVISHDSKQSWYKGWSIGLLENSGRGVYLNAGLSLEVNIGFSWNDDISAMAAGTDTLGGSAGGGMRFIGGGYEISGGPGVAPISNISLGISTPTPIPVTFLEYETNTRVTRIWGN
jgi:hypothetical protein